MGNWFTPNYVCHSHGVEGAKTPKTGITSKSKHTVKYPYMPPAMRPVPYSEKLPVPKPPENLNFSEDNSDANEDHGQQEGDNVVVIRYLKQVVSHLNPIY
jgi:hypothetical protein